MNSISGYLEQSLNFIKEHRTADIVSAFQQIDWRLVLHSPLFWLVGVPATLLLAYKRQFGILLVLVTGALFISLVQLTAPEPGQPMAFTQLLGFIGGAVALIGLDLYYFLMVRE